MKIVHNQDGKFIFIGSLADIISYQPSGEIWSEKSIAEPDLMNSTWSDSLIDFIPHKSIQESIQEYTVSVHEFLKRFTIVERISIRTAAASDPIIADFLSMIDVVDTVISNSDDVRAGLDYFVFKKLMTQERANEIRGT